MKKSSKYINDKVFKLNKKYSKLQNETEELFFRCLDEGRSVEYFYKKLEDIWGKIDHSFMDNEINEYADLITQNNLQITGKKKAKNKHIPIDIAIFLILEKKFMKMIKKRYSSYYNSPAYKRDKEEYLKKKVKSYDNQMIPYYDEYGNIVRYVQLSTYLAMRYNTALTRAAWNRTLEDAELLGYSWFWIPPHAFSCKHCVGYQGRPLTIDEVNIYIEEANEGDILHPNCKCELLIYTPLTQLVTQNLSMGEVEEYYDIRQKVNSLTLKKDRILTDIRIQGRLGNQDEVDKLNSQRNKINSQIRDLINKLPTNELKRIVTAINR